MKTFTLAPDGKSITCLKCGKTSYNLNDVKEKYCGFCHEWHPDPDNPNPLPWHTCPVCGYRTDYASCVTDRSKERPEPGDISACLKCGEVFIFTDTLDMRQADLNGLLELSPAHRKMLGQLQSK